MRASPIGLNSVGDGAQTWTSCPASRRSCASSSTTRFSPDVWPERYRECRIRIFIARRGNASSRGDHRAGLRLAAARVRVEDARLLQEEQREVERVQEQVAPPKTTWLEREPPHPLEPECLNTLGRGAERPGQIVVPRTDRHHGTRQATAKLVGEAL